MRAAAFTLLELLIVVAVIAVLAGMIVAGISSVRFRARALDTTHRIEAVLSGVASYAKEEGSTAQALQTAFALGGVQRFSTLETIASVAKAGGAGRSEAPYLQRPDGSGNLWGYYNDPPSTAIVYHPGSDEDQQQRPLWKFVFDALPPASGAVAATYYTDAWRYSWPESDWDSGGTTPPVLRFPWGKPGLALNGAICDAAKPASAVLAKVTEWKSVAAWQKNDFSDASKYAIRDVTNSWVTDGSAAGAARLQFTVADAAQTAPVSSTVVGRRSDGTTAVTVDANQPLPFDLGWLSPLATIPLLQAAGTLDPITGAADYRRDRGVQKPWNDAWGNPLVVSYALFQPERFHRRWDGDDRRDLLLKKATEAYGYNRSIYLAAGAIGPERAGMQAQLDALAGSSGASEDLPALAAMWKRIGAACEAWTWTEASFAAPPWAGVKLGKKGGMRSFLSAPLEVR